MKNHYIKKTVYLINDNNEEKYNLNFVNFNLEKA